MKKPAKTWPTAVLTSVIRPTTSPSLDCVGDRVLGPVDVVVDLRVARVQRTVLEPVLDLVEARDRLVGEVGGAVGDLLAGEGEQQPDQRDAGDHHAAARPARAGSRAGTSPSTIGITSAVISSAITTGSDDHAKVADRQEDDVPGGDDDQEPPRPGRREVHAPRHLGAGEVDGAAATDRHVELGLTLVAQVGELVGEPGGEPLLVLLRLRRGGAAGG